MPLLNLSATDFLAAFQRLLPRGRAWPREPDATITKALATLMPTYARLAARDNNLITDTFPSTSVETLPEWEASVGLPDPCAGPEPTIALRQAQVVARFTSLGGQSVPEIIAYAAKLGFTITITEFAPARFGLAKFGDPMRGPAWASAWQVNAPTTTIIPAKFGSARFGDPFRTWGNAVLECELRRIAPAHTALSFAYSG